VFLRDEMDELWILLLWLWPLVEISWSRNISIVYFLVMSLSNISYQDSRRNCSVQSMRSVI
jgi:hypothetical protein